MPDSCLARSPAPENKLVDDFAAEKMLAHNPRRILGRRAAIFGRTWVYREVRPEVAAPLAAADNQVGYLLCCLPADLVPERLPDFLRSQALTGVAVTDIYTIASHISLSIAR